MRAARWLLFSLTAAGLLAVPSLSLSYAYLNRILFDHNNAAYLSGPAGLYQYSASGWQPVSLPVARGSLSAAAWDKQGRLWIAGRDRACLCVTAAPGANFFLRENQFPGGIASIAFENDAVVWLGTSNQGLFRVDVQGKTS